MKFNTVEYECDISDRNNTEYVKILHIRDKKNNNLFSKFHVYIIDNDYFINILYNHTNRDTNLEFNNINYLFSKDNDFIEIFKLNQKGLIL